MKVKDWLAEHGQSQDRVPKSIARQLGEMNGVEDYEYETALVWEDSTAPENPGMVMSVECVAHPNDEKVICTVRSGN